MIRSTLSDVLKRGRDHQVSIFIIFRVFSIWIENNVFLVRPAAQVRRAETASTTVFARLRKRRDWRRFLDEEEPQFRRIRGRESQRSTRDSGRRGKYFVFYFYWNRKYRSVINFIFQPKSVSGRDQLAVSAQWWVEFQLKVIIIFLLIKKFSI